jgi:hypothetical protein
VTYEPPAPASGPEASDADAIAAEWRRRTQAEYTSAAIAHQVTLWLIQIGGPPDLIRDGLRIVDDELAHSELSAEVMAASGGTFAPPAIDGASLVLPGGDNAHTALVSTVTRFFCVGESVAVPLFRMLRERCSVPTARKTLDRVMRDEPRHRQFGWDVLDWLLLGDEESVVSMVTGVLPTVMADVESAYGNPGGGGEQPPTDLSPGVRAWGMAGRADYARTLSTCLAQDVLPRFAARGVTIAASGGDPHPTS